MSYWRPSGSSFSSANAASTLGARGEASDSSTNIKEVLFNTRGSHLPLSHQRQQLPIAQLKREILYCVETFQTTILIGETGCGKSTQLPQFLYEAGWAAGERCIVCTQPRRIAAMAVAARTASEMGCTLGEEVGYAIRFDSKCNNNTSIKYCTDGLLLRETMQDPLLSKYSVIIVDEAHERSLYTDILLGLLKKIHRKRPDLRVVIASASLDAQELKDFFETHQSINSSLSSSRSSGNGSSSSSGSGSGSASGEGSSSTHLSGKEGQSACVLSIAGRTHPVDVLYLEESCSNYVQTAVRTCIEIHQSLEEWGDILVSNITATTDDTNCLDIIHIM
jgi:ATP-dependent RNA helicase DDX35